MLLIDYGRQVYYWKMTENFLNWFWLANQLKQQGEIWLSTVIKVIHCSLGFLLALKNVFFLIIAGSNALFYGSQVCSNNFRFQLGKWKRKLFEHSGLPYFWVHHCKVKLLHTAKTFLSIFLKTNFRKRGEHFLPQGC